MSRIDTLAGGQLKDLVNEARSEVTGARVNLQQAIRAWELVVASLNPAVLVLTAAERRLEKAEALLRSALERE